jgi:hypothetical protein
MRFVQRTIPHRQDEGERKMRKAKTKLEPATDCRAEVKRGGMKHKRKLRQ